MENNYNFKLNKYLEELPSKCYIFEITKECGYSSLIFIYKDETLMGYIPNYNADGTKFKEFEKNIL